MTLSFKINLPSLVFKSPTLKIMLAEMKFIPFIIIFALTTFICISLSQLEIPLVSYAVLAAVLTSFCFIIFLYLRNSQMTLFGFILFFLGIYILGITLVQGQDLKNCIYTIIQIWLEAVLVFYFCHRYDFIIKCFAISLSACVYANFIHIISHPELLINKDTFGITAFLLGGNYNQMGIRILTALGANIICLGMSKKWRYNLIPLFIISLLSLLIVGSMTAVSGILIFLIICILPSKKLKKLSILCIFIFFVLFQVFVVSKGTGLENNEFAVYVIEDIMQKDITFTERTSIWDNAMNTIAQSPIYGYGFVDDAWFLSNMYSEALGPHNMVLGILIHGGIILLIIYIILLYMSYRKIEKYNNNTAILLLAANAVALVMCLMEMTQYPILLMLPIFMYYYGYNRDNKANLSIQK